MPDEVEEIQPAAEEPLGDPSRLGGTDDTADTMAGGEAPIEDAEAADVSDTMAESSVVSGQEEAMGGMPMPDGRAAAHFGPAKPRSNLFTLLLILSFLCIGLAIYLLGHELNNYYGVTFGGILSPPNKTAETTDTGR